MKIVIVNGRKMNSFALSLEAVSKFASENHNIEYVDLNTFSSRISPKKRFLLVTLKTFRVSISNRRLSLKYFYDLKSVRSAISWYEAAKNSADPWNYKENEKDLPVGKVIKSLIARTMGSSQFNLEDCSLIQVLDIASKVYFSYMQTLYSIDKSNLPVELGIAHGGRDAYSAGAVLAFRERKIPTKLIESGGISTNWSCFENSPHYSPDFWNRLEKTRNYKEFESISEWWEKRIKGSDHFRSEEWAHTRVYGLLPENLPNQFVSFFTTSDFEIPVFEDFDIFPGNFHNQIDALRELISVTQRKNIHLVVRRHPNSISSNGIDREDAMWKEFQSLPHVTYIGPKEKIDSITLARMSKVVYTFKSSVGIESIWLGTPAYAMGPARWAWSEDLRTWDLTSLERSLDLGKKIDNSHSLRWASMMMQMDYPCSVFNEIHGNFARVGDKILRNSALSSSLENFVFFLVSKFVH